MALVLENHEVEHCSVQGACQLALYTKVLIATVLQECVAFLSCRLSLHKRVRIARYTRLAFQLLEGFNKTVSLPMYCIAFIAPGC